MIWDLHCHIAGANLIGRTPEERLTQLIATANRFGIERLCVSMGTKFSRDPAPETIRKQNDEVLRAISKYPERAFGFVYLNPKHVDTALAELDRIVANGPMVGVKLWTAQRASAPELDPIIKRTMRAWEQGAKDPSDLCFPLHG